MGIDCRGMKPAEQIHEMMRRSVDTGGRHTSLGMCIFAGGFSLGMEQAGFRVIGHLEYDGLDLGSRTAQQRWPSVVMPTRGADRMSWESVIAQLRDENLVPDVVHANPPCLAFAGTGKHEGTSSDAMCWLRACVYDGALELEPKAFVWELVPAVFTKAEGLLRSMAFQARRKGYKSYAFLTTSAIHGGFQDRRRFHFIASRYELDFEGSYERSPDEEKASRTLGDALEELRGFRYSSIDDGTECSPANELASDRDHRDHKFGPMGVLPNDTNLYRGAFRDLFPHTAPGSHLGYLPDSLLREVYRPRGQSWTGEGRPGFAHTRGRMDRPSPNVLGGHTIVHPELDRYLTPREHATIMGYPPNFEFSPGTKAYAEIGKGLCTHNARFVGRVISDGLLEGTEASPSNDITVIDWRGRARVNSLTMPADEQAAWYENRHGCKPPDGYGGRNRG